MEEDELIERARVGDAEAYGVIVRSHADLALRVAFAICGSRPEAEDAVQDAFIKAYQALDRFRGGRPLRPWLMSIVANEARNKRRSAARRHGLVERAATRRPDAPPAPDDVALARIESAWLLAAVATLDERDRTVIALRYFAGLGEAETALALDCPPGTVKSRLSRALMRLRAALETAEVDRRAVRDG